MAKKPLTDEQKAKKAEAQRARRAAARTPGATRDMERLAKSTAKAVAEAQEAAAADAAAQAVIDGHVTFEDAARALLAGATLEQVAELAEPDEGGPVTVVLPQDDDRPAGDAKAVGRKVAEVRNAGPRGKGTKATDDMLRSAAARWRDQGLSQRQALEAVYWLDGLSLGDVRFLNVTRDLWEVK